jgi:hypothetical protein
LLDSLLQEVDFPLALDFTSREKLKAEKRDSADRESRTSQEFYQQQQFYSSLVQTGADWCRLVQTGADWCRLVLTVSSEPSLHICLPLSHLSTPLSSVYHPPSPTHYPPLYPPVLGHPEEGSTLARQAGSAVCVESGVYPPLYPPPELLRCAWSPRRGFYWPGRQCSAVRESRVSVEEYSAELCSKEEYSAELCSMEEYSAVLCSVEEYSAVLCSVEESSAALCSVEGVLNFFLPSLPQTFLLTKKC